MERIKQFFANILEKYRSSWRRYPVAFGLIGIECALGVFAIISEYDDEWFYYLMFAIAVGIFMAIFLSLFNMKDETVATLAGSLITILGVYLYLQLAKETVYKGLHVVALPLILLCLSCWILFRNDKDGTLCAHLVSSAFYVQLLCGLLLGGLCVCLAAFQYLIYNFDKFYKMYLIAAFVVECGVGSCLFLSYVPDEPEEHQISKAYSTIIHKTLMLVYYILIFILYGYLIKVIFTRHMPVGQLNWFGSFALLFYCFFLLSSRFENTALSNMQQKYGGLILLPIFLFQSYAIWIRISHYGLTTLRFVSILFNLGGLAFIVSSFFENRRHLVFVFLAFLIFAGAYTPWNILDVPVKNQISIIEHVLKENGLYPNGNILPSDKLSEEARDRIRSAYDYIVSSDSDKKGIFEGKKRSDFEDIFGFPYYKEGGEKTDNIIYCWFDSTLDIDISGYDHLEAYNRYSYNERDERFEQFCLDLYEKYGSHSSEAELIYQRDENSLIILTSCSFQIDTETGGLAGDYHAEGFLLTRKAAEEIPETPAEENL